MEDKNQLSDIILDKNNSASNNKKIILAVATLGIILIIVVVLMNSLTSKGTNNLPQPLLPQPLITSEEESKSEYSNEYDEPLFEEVEVIDDIDEDLEHSENLTQIAKKLKAESLADEEIRNIEYVMQENYTKKIKPVVPKIKKEKKVYKKVVPKSSATGRYYIQVGSFSIYEPNKKFLKSIVDKGYNYKYHKVNQGSSTISKILVGPYRTEKEVRSALKSVRRDIVAGAFLTKI